VAADEAKVHAYPIYAKQKQFISFHVQIPMWLY
jgi:hypothetical protein